jgi:hypothetical protein
MNLSSQIAIRRYRRADDGTAVRMLSFLPTLYPNGMLWLQKRLDDVVDGKAQCRLASFLSAPAGIAIETPKSCSSGSATVDCRLSTSPLTPIIPVYPERILRRALNEKSRRAPNSNYSRTYEPNRCKSNYSRTYTKQGGRGAASPKLRT